jgi:putative restriction endonuclease
MAREVSSTRICAVRRPATLSFRMPIKQLGIGRIAEFAFTAPKPMEFGETGACWNQEGWLLPIFWTPLSPSIHPKTIIGSLGPLLPRRYSPIHLVSSSGATFSHEALSRCGSNSLTFEVINELLDDIVEGRIADDDPLEGTIKKSVPHPWTLLGNTN